MERKKTTPRSCSYDGVRTSTGEDEQSIARRTEQGGWALGIATVVTFGVPMLLKAAGL